MLWARRSTVSISATPQSDTTIAAIRALLLEYGVIFFRDQRVNDAGLKSFANRFGTLFRHPYFLPEGDPDVIVIRRAPGDKRIVGEGWHSDTPAAAAPPMASLLYGEDIPTHGGDTQFANQYLAHDTLSPAMQRMLEGIRAVYSDTRFAGSAVRRNAQSATKSREDAAFNPSLGVHPVVRTHPETGRKALYIVRPLMSHFDGMTEAESDGIGRIPIAKTQSPSRIHLPVSLADRLAGVLGQPVHAAHRAE